MKIIVDAFGGDNAPLEIIKASRMACDELGYEIILVGDDSKIKSVAEENKIHGRSSYRNNEIQNRFFYGSGFEASFGK